MIRLRVLGSVDLRNADGQSVHTLLAQPKRVALLALLCTHSGDDFVRRDVIASLFWPEHDHEHARAGLRTGLHSLRRALGEVIVTRGNDEVGVTPDSIWCDAAAFEKSCNAAQWQDALALYHGEFLAGMHVQDSSAELDRWIEQQRTHYRQLATNAARQLSALEERRGNLTSALQLGRRAVGWNDTDEVGVRRLLRLHAALGDRAGALAVFEAFSGKLREELEVEPSAETLELVDAIRRGRTAFPASQSPVLQAAHVPLMLTPGDRLRRWAAAAAGVAVVLILLGSAWSITHRASAVLPAAPASGNVSELATSVRGFLQLGNMPMPLSNMSAVYDAAHDMVYVFGGRMGEDLTSDVWVMDAPSRVGSVSWTRIQPRGRPPQPRWMHTAVYDSATDQMIVFGGGLGGSTPCVNDLWVLKNPSRRSGNAEWLELKPTGALPTPRGDHAAVWIPGVRRMITFGGHDCIARRVSDTWVLDMHVASAPSWRRVASSGPTPAARSHHTMVYDDREDRILLFGGGVDRLTFDDVWELRTASSDTARWRPLRLRGYDRPRLHAHRAVWDAIGREMIVFGGQDSARTMSNTVWTLRDDGEGAVRWRRLDGLPSVPSARVQHGMFYIAALDELIIFGGGSTGALQYDAWALMNVTERRLTQKGAARTR